MAAGLPDADRLLGAAAAALRRRAEEMDGSAAASASEPAPAGGPDEPGVLASTGDVLVLWKPPGWAVSVDDGDDEGGEDGAGLGGAHGPGRLLEEHVIV